MNPEELRFSKTHEWAHTESNSAGEQIASIGISAFAVEALTDLVFIELPEKGRQVVQGEPFGEIESVKAVSDLYSPVSGEVAEVNSALADQLEVLNDDCYGAGWMIKVKLAEGASLDHLMDYAEYQKQCAEEQ